MPALVFMCDDATFVKLIVKNMLLLLTHIVKYCQNQTAYRSDRRILSSLLPGVVKVYATEIYFDASVRMYYK